MSGTLTPPGWYPDPANPYQQRYWDGAAWTDATAPAPPGFGAPGYGAPGYGAPGYGAPGYGAPGYGTTQVGYGYAQGVGAPLAGFWPRVGAYLVDGIVLAIPYNVLSVVVLGSSTLTVEPDSSFTLPAGFWLLWALSILGGIAYYALLEGGSTGQTLGKKLVGIRVVDADTLQPGVGVGRGIGRYFARFLSSAVCALGYFWMLWDDQNQTWHDKLARTKVVVAPR